MLTSTSSKYSFLSSKNFERKKEYSDYHLKELSYSVLLQKIVSSLLFTLLFPKEKEYARGVLEERARTGVSQEADGSQQLDGAWRDASGLLNHLAHPSKRRTSLLAWLSGAETIPFCSLENLCQVLQGILTKKQSCTIYQTAPLT